MGFVKNLERTLVWENIHFAFFRKRKKPGDLTSDIILDAKSKGWGMLKKRETVKKPGPGRLAEKQGSRMLQGRCWDKPVVGVLQIFEETLPRMLQTGECFLLKCA